MTTPGVHDYRMPSLGADMKDGRVLEWFVGPGDAVRRGDVVGVVDTDKGAIEIEIWEDAVIDEIVVGPGAKVPVGEVLLHLREPRAEDGGSRPGVGAIRAVPTAGEAPEGGEGPPVSVRASPAARRRAQELGVDLDDVTGSGPEGAVLLSDVLGVAGRERSASSDGVAIGLDRGAPAGPRATPVARRAAEALGVDLSHLTGTGPGGAVTRDDVVAAAAAARATMAEPTPTTSVDIGGPREGGAGAKPAAVPAPEAPAGTLSTMREAIAAAMARSKREIPHYYLGTTVSARAAVEWLAETNAARLPADRLLAVSLFVKSIAMCLHDFPELNGHWTDGRFLPSAGVHPGVAVSLRGGGLVAPALFDADRATLPELSSRVSDLVRRARGGRLRASEMTGATITVSSMGERGVDTLFGVIHPPQVALVGVGRVAERPWAEGGMLGVHPVVSLTLSGDHRVSDGLRGALFLHAVGELLQNPEAL